MRIGQALDKIMEDEERQFEGELDGFKYEITCVNGEIETMVENAGSREKKVIWGIPLARISKKIDWELVQKPISFMEAVESGKNIKLINMDDKEGMMTEYMDINLFLKKLYDFHSNSLARDIIINGEFYIEEGLK